MKLYKRFLLGTLFLETLEGGDLNAGLRSMDEEAKRYFNSLPPMLQEQLMQSTADLNTKEDLMRYCSNALGNNARGKS